MAPSTRSRILRVWSTKYGLTLKPDSLAWLETLVEHFELLGDGDDVQDEETLAAFNDAMEKMAKGYTTDFMEESYAQIVTVDALEQVYARLQAVEGAAAGTQGGQGDAAAALTTTATHALVDGDGLDPSTYTRVIDAFDMPWLHFDGEKKTFVHHNNLTSSNANTKDGARKKPSIAGAPESRAMYLRDRYNILKQVILRNEHFSPPALPGHDRDNYMKLTGIKNLLGRQGGHFLLFGMLTRTEDGRFALEDLDDKIVLDLSDASPASGMFTEGCFALVDGLFTKDSIFKVYEIGHPPSEKREVSRSIYGHVDFLGTGALTLTEEAKLRESEKKGGDSFLVFSDLHLDSAKDLSHFRNVLQVYETQQDPPPSLCILCGNFSSKPVVLSDGKGLKEYAANFTSFGDLLLSYPRCAREMYFIFVPGPNDPFDVSNLVLPRRALPNSLVSGLKSKLPKVSFPSNPCRISYKSSEIVIFRDDLMSRMLRNTVRLKADLATLANEQLNEIVQSEMQREEEENGTRAKEWSDEKMGEARKKVLSQFLVQTVLDQSHLAPFPLQVRPILWEFDQALRLFPLPTALILADKYLPYEVTYEDCHVFNPGGFAGSDYTWSVCKRVQGGKYTTSRGRPPTDFCGQSENSEMAMAMVDVPMGQNGHQNGVNGVNTTPDWQGRWKHVDRILTRPSPFAPDFTPGAATQEFLRTKSKILVIGAGGLGCEILANLALLGFADIHVIDMDTIDISNLNRQFLFRQKDVGRPKAIAAAEFIMRRVPGCKVTPYYGKIQDKDDDYYMQFNIVICGLDSVEARRWMNATLVRLVDPEVEESLKPLIDGGTEGFKGQARVILPTITACYECSLDLHTPQTTYPLCTIQNTPRLPEHCISWASVLEWPRVFKDKKMDTDDPDHIGWLFEQASKRAKEFKIEGVTWSLTQGVVKNIIPAIASTNAIIAAASCNEAFKIATSSASYLNNYMAYSGTESPYTHTFEYEKKPQCPVCGGEVAEINASGSQTLEDFIEDLKARPDVQLKRPSFSLGGAPLYWAAPAQIEQSTRPNLSKTLSELLKGGEDISVTDSALPIELNLRVTLV